jgi:hypothetical protein
MNRASSGDASSTASHPPSVDEGNDAYDDDERRPVAFEMRLLSIDETFVYRIPPMRSADGHRAEDWNLANPIMTCSLLVMRRDDELHVDVMASRQKPNAPPGAMETYLYARCEISPDVASAAGHGQKGGAERKLEYWVNPAVDTSRYFAIRIKDPRSGREAYIGMGFRERADATNFRMSIDDYVDSIKREVRAEELRRQYEDGCSKDGGGDSAGVVEALPIPTSSLSLKEGEKLHINIAGKRENPIDGHPPKVKGTGALGGLKKPPPPPPRPEDAPASDYSSERGLTNNEAASDADIDWGDFEG